jgi:RimJ/RimL family protein N-acetyltransferase
VLPPGYPAECEESVTLEDGATIFIRPLVPADADLLRFALEEADPETLFFRFFRSSIRVDAELIEYLTVLDYHRRFALAAFSEGGDGIGVARYEGNPVSDTAEMAVVVRPDWRRRGVGTALLVRLAAAATARGLRYLRADFLATNQAAGALLAKAGLTPPVYEGGVGSVLQPLPVAGEETPPT